MIPFIRRHRWWFIGVAIYLISGFTISKFDFSWGFSVKRTGTFGEWSAALGATAVIAYMQYSYEREKTAKKDEEKNNYKLVLNDLLVEVVQNQKKLNPDGIYDTLRIPMRSATEGLTSVHRISHHLGESVLNLIHAVLHDMHFRNAIIDQMPSYGTTVPLRDVDEYVKRSLNVLRQVLETLVDQKVGAHALAQEELDNRELQHEEYLQKSDS